MRDWEAEHKSGEWSFLADMREQGRLALVAALAALHGNSTVVDFGCASGQLRRWLDPRIFRRYIGVDITAAAFQNNAESIIESEWIEAAAECYRPEPIPGAAAVFSEILYYLERPEHELVRLCHALKAGCAIVSVTVPGTKYPHYVQRVDAIWQAIGRLTWPLAADLTLSGSSSGERWRIVALVPS